MLAIAEFQKQEGTKTGGYFYLGRKKKKKRQFKAPDWLSWPQCHLNFESASYTLLAGHWCWSWTSTLWPPHAKSQLTGKEPDAGKDWGQEEKGATEKETVGWHHRLDGRDFEQAPGDGEEKGSFVCYSPWGRKESDMTERLNDKSKKFLANIYPGFLFSMC